MEKTKMGQETRHKILYDKFRQYISWNSHYWKNIPREAQDRIDEVFCKFIDSIVYVDYMEILSTDHIYDHYIAPLLSYALRVEEYKQREGIKSEISRGTMNDPDIRFDTLVDLCYYYTVSNDDYWEKVPEDIKRCVGTGLDNFIDYIIEIDYMAILSIGQIFCLYIRPLIDSAVISEEAIQAKILNPDESPKFINLKRYNRKTTLVIPLVDILS